MANALSTSPQVYARSAALIGIVGIANGIFAEAVVRGDMIVAGDAATTAQNILAAEGLFRAGFMSDVAVFMIDIIITVLLYVLLRPVNRNLALMAALFRIAMTAILALNNLHQYAALLVLDGDPALAAFDQPQLQALSMLFLRVHSAGYSLGLVFFSGHCLLLGYLLFNARYFPRFLGVLIVITGLSYLSIGLINLVFVAYKDYAAYLLAPAALGEFVLTGWLLIRGVNVGKWNERQATLSAKVSP